MDAILISARRSIGDPDDARRHLIEHEKLYWEVKFGIKTEQFDRFPILGFIHVAGEKDWDNVDYEATINNIIPFRKTHYEGSEATLIKPEPWLKAWKANVGEVRLGWKKALVMTHIEPCSYKLTSFIKYKDGGAVKMPPQRYIRVISPHPQYEEIVHEFGASPSEIEDIAAIQRDTTISDTERAALVKARLGQGQFRAALLRRWTNGCAVTGCTLSEILRASHMKPWRESTNVERLDAANGLLLVAHLDALFDKKLISFTDDGEMLVSNRVGITDQQLLGVPRRLRSSLNGKEKAFLALHRDRFRILNV
jgi:hypothetical protein